MTEATLTPARAETAHENLPQPHFDRIARPYRWLEYLSFGPALQRTRTHWLSAIRQRESALVLGDGDGRFTAALLEASPRVHIHAVDLSQAMLQLLCARGGNHSAGRLRAEHADLRAWTPAAHARYDLVATHFFLDCLTTAQVADLIERLKPALAPGALWLVSDFAVPRTPFGRWIAQPLVAALYRAFHVLTGLSVNRLPDHAAALESAGLRLQGEQRRLKGLLVSQLWELPSQVAPSPTSQPAEPCTADEISNV